MNPLSLPFLPRFARAAAPVAVFLCFTARLADGAVVLDGFEDGDRTNGADAGDIAWYEANQNQVLSVVNVSPLAGTYSMNVNVGGVDRFKRVVGFFTPTTIPGTGSFVELSFSFRLLATIDNTNGFRFGLYNSNGTQITADDPDTSFNTSEADDFGYNARIPLGSAAAPNLLDEPAGDNTLGGGAAGSALGNLTTSNVAINDALNHDFRFRIERTGASSLSVTTWVDGIQRATGDDSGTIVTTFDAIYFGTGNADSIDYMIDDVMVAVPEPSSALALLGGLAWLGLRRSRRVSASRGWIS